MKVFVTGATGVLGRNAVSDLTDRGHDVVGLSRDERGDRRVERAGGVPRRGDLFDPDSLRPIAEGADAVVHAATTIPTGTRPSASDWRENDRVRLEGARTLLTVAEDVGAGRLLFPSVVWAFRREDGATITVDEPPNPDRTTRSAVGTERLLEHGTETSDVDATVLRLGWLYGPSSAQTRTFGRRLLARRLPIVGAGPLGRETARVSCLHERDAGRAIGAAVDAGVTGTYHVVDDEPVTTAAFFETFAAALGAPSPRRVPGWLARLVVGRDAVRFLTNAFPTASDRFRHAAAWEPRYETVERGLEAVVDAWLERGLLRERADGYEWVGPDERDGERLEPARRGDA